MGFPLFLHEIDVQKIDYSRFLLPKCDIGRDDIEITVDYGKTPNDKDMIAFNVWSRIGNSTIKGFIYTAHIRASEDEILSIIAKINNDPKFMDTVNEFIEHFSELTQNTMDCR